MICQLCKGLGNIVKADPKTGSFEVIKCSSCRDDYHLLNAQVKCVRMGKLTTITQLNKLSILTRTIWSGELVTTGLQNRLIFEQAIDEGDEVKINLHLQGSH